MKFLAGIVSEVNGEPGEPGLLVIYEKNDFIVLLIFSLKGICLGDSGYENWTDAFFYLKEDFGLNREDIYEFDLEIDSRRPSSILTVIDRLRGLSTHDN
jgi:hypothetical protein